MAAFNHVGHCVADLDRSRRFYVDLLDFRFWWGMDVDDAAAALLRLAPPMGMRAEYYVRDGVVLELLHFGHIPPPPAPERLMSHAGLTHLSLSVDDLDSVLDLVGDFGGEVLSDTRSPFAAFVRDPDGQLVELLTMAWRDSRPPLPLDEDDPISVVGRYFDHMARGDIGVSSLFHDDARLVGLGTETVGQPAIDAFYRQSIAGASPSPRSAGPLMVDGDRVAAEIYIDLADGTTMHVMDLFVVDDGLIRSLTYFVADHEITPNQ